MCKPMRMCFLYMCMHLNMYIKVGPYERVYYMWMPVYYKRICRFRERHGCIYVNCMYNLNIDACIKDACIKEDRSSQCNLKRHMKEWTEFSEQLLERERVLLR